MGWHDSSDLCKLLDKLPLSVDTRRAMGSRYDLKIPNLSDPTDVLKKSVLPCRVEGDLGLVDEDGVLIGAEQQHGEKGQKMLLI